MGKKAFIDPWDGVTPVEGLTRVATPEPKAAPVATPVVEAATPPAAPEATAPAAEPATPAPAANPFATVDPNLMGLAAVLMVRRLRELREKEKK